VNAPGHGTTSSGLALRKCIVVASPARVNMSTHGLRFNGCPFWGEESVVLPDLRLVDSPVRSGAAQQDRLARLVALECRSLRA
jgi:hypothetical protein